MVKVGSMSKGGARVVILTVCLVVAGLIGAVFATADIGGGGCGYGGYGNPAYCHPGGSAVITGTVFQQDTEAPLQYVTVEATDAAGKHYIAVTSSTGLFSITGLPAGDYELSFLRYGHVPQVYDGVTDPGDATTISLADGEVRSVVAHLEPEAGQISGTVTDATTGDPVAGACIQYALVPNFGDPSAPPNQVGGSCPGAFTGPAGRYVLGGIAGGFEYVVQASDPTNLHITRYYQNAIDPTTANRVTPDAIAIDFALIPADGDGVTEPPGFDGNSDGIPDDEQADVATVPAATDGSPVTVAAPDDTYALAAVTTQPIPADNPPPAGVEFPYGLVGFTVELPSGETHADVQVVLPAGSAPTRYFKLEGTSWIDFTDHVDFSGNVVTLHLVDGGAGDADGEENGVIVDPGGAGSQIGTTTAITEVTREPSITTLAYWVNGTVTTDSPIPAGNLPGKVTVSGDGANCVDDTLVATGATDEYGFSCKVVSGPPGANVPLTAKYKDPDDNFLPSEGSTPHSVVAMPPAPGGVTATTPPPGSRATTVNASVPQGPVPTGYQIRCIPVGLSFKTGPGPGSDAVWLGTSSLPAQVDGLTRGLRYQCKVRARYGPVLGGEAGDQYEGPLSAWSNAFVVPKSVPPAPTGVTASAPTAASPRSTRVSWTKVPNDTGAPVTFQVRCASPDGGAIRALTTPNAAVQVNGLSPRRHYTCTVRATNSVGSSAWVNSNAIVTR